MFILKFIISRKNQNIEVRLFTRKLSNESTMTNNTEKPNQFGH